MAASFTKEELIFNGKDPKPVLHYIRSLNKLFNDVAPNASAEQKELFNTLTKNIIRTGCDTVQKIKETEETQLQQIEDELEAKKSKIYKIQMFAKLNLKEGSLEEVESKVMAEKVRLETEQKMVEEEKVLLEEKIANVEKEHNTKLSQILQDFQDNERLVRSETAEIEKERIVNTKF